MADRAHTLDESHRTAPGRGGYAWLLLCAIGLAGCGDGTAPGPVATVTAQTYFGPAMPQSQLGRATFTIDPAKDSFVQNLYQGNAGYEQYVYSSGNYTTLGSGILDIGITYGQGSTLQGTLYNPPQTGNWVVQLAGQAGFVGLLNQPVVPIVPNRACPSFATPVAYQFVTIPSTGDATGTAYGKAAIGTSGTTVTFSGIAQSSIAGGAPANPSAATVSGTCASTFFGQTIAIPATQTVTDPGTGPAPAPSATMAIGPAGFLVEDNGNTGGASAVYENTLGAGNGAVGLPVPASALTTSALVAAQYNGFLYSTGGTDPKTKGRLIDPSSSLIASFGYTNVQAACPTLPAPQTPTILYGGEFTGNDPSTNAQSNCDVAIDLGAQDAQQPGLYPGATIYLSAAFPRTPSNSGYKNQTSAAYSFPAVAIAGQLQGKFAILLVAYDATGLQSVVAGATQDWGIYLLQSN